jgi:hypothetical protein
MSNKIFQTILDRKIEYFVQSFVIDAKSIFYKDDKLFHPGEYGKFRESTLKELLKLVIPTSLQIGEGFVITSNDKVSTQCDVVIFDNENLPLLNDGIYQFYTIESTLAIGEVKSDLNKTQFKDALIKLAKNKMLQDDRIENIKKRKSNSKENEHLFTFLICRKFQFGCKIDFSDIYEDIPQKYWHNCILSIEDGIFHYNFPVLNLSQKLKEHYMKILGMNLNLFWDYPIHQEDEIEYLCFQSFTPVNLSDKQKHIIFFIKCIINSLDTKTTYNTEFLSYSNLEFVTFDK